MEMKSGKWLSRLIKFFVQGSLIFFTLFFLVSEITEQDPQIAGDLVELNATPDTLQVFSKAYVLGPGRLHLATGSAEIRYFAPREFLDPVYALLFFLISLILVFYFWDFSYKNPFTRKALIGLEIGFVILLAFIIVNTMRSNWFDEQIQTYTNGQYGYNKPKLILSPVAWILFALFRVIRIFMKGVSLQKENELTV